MSLLNQVTTAPDSRIAEGGYPPVRINIQGIDGIGKSTFGADADDSIFIQAEDGLGFIDNTARFPVANTWEEIRDQVRSLIEEDHKFKTVVLDTTDAAAKLAEEFVIKENNWKSANDPKASYGAFYVAEENADFNLFADYDKTLNSDGTARSSGNRFLYTRYSMGFEAKARLAIPEQLPLSWDAFITAYKKALNPTPSTKTEAA